MQQTTGIKKAYRQKHSIIQGDKIINQTSQNRDIVVRYGKKNAMNLSF